MTHKEAIKQLKSFIKKGDTVYTILRHTSRSGMMRHISVVVIRKGRPHCIDYMVARALDYKQADNGGLKVGGCGMDMGFHLIYRIASELFKDGYAIEHSWL